MGPGTWLRLCVRRGGNKILRTRRRSGSRTGFAIVTLTTPIRVTVGKPSWVFAGTASATTELTVITQLLEPLYAPLRAANAHVIVIFDVTEPRTGDRGDPVRAEHATDRCV